MNADTNFSYRVQSDTTGTWSISPVRIGTYKIAISAGGFQQVIVGPVTLDVQQRQRADVTLLPGQVSQSVQISASAPQLQTDSSETGQVIDSPGYGRVPHSTVVIRFSLHNSLSGVTTSEPGARDSGGFGFSASGARSLDNNFLLDGVDNNSEPTGSAE